MDTERHALDDGVDIWQQTVKIVSDFESALKRIMNGQSSASTPMEENSKGKQKILSPEEAMRDQLAKMGDVIRELEEREDYVVDKAYNPLICAVGAEVEAFKEGRKILIDALQAAGLQIDEPREALELTNSTNETTNDNAKRGIQSHRGLSDSVVYRKEETENLPNHRDRSPPDLLGEEPRSDEPHNESDNEVPAGLFGEVHKDESEDEHHNEIPAEFLSRHGSSKFHTRDPDVTTQGSLSSENEVPADLLAEQERRDDHDALN